LEFQKTILNCHFKTIETLNREQRNISLLPRSQGESEVGIRHRANFGFSIVAIPVVRQRMRAWWERTAKNNDGEN